MLFTKSDLDDWLKTYGVFAGYSPLTKTILRLGGGIEDDSANNWLSRAPPIVTSYEQCFDQMIQSESFKVYIESLGDTQSDFWQDFDKPKTWDFFRDTETKYNCAGVCVKPLFFMTKDISKGPPMNECIQEIIDDVYDQSEYMLTGMGAAFARIGLLQLTLFGGMAPSSNGEEMRRDQFMEVTHLSQDFTIKSTTPN